jgi:hypothetical protein
LVLPNESTNMRAVKVHLEIVCYPCIPQNLCNKVMELVYNDCNLWHPGYVWLKPQWTQSAWDLCMKSSFPCTIFVVFNFFIPTVSSKSLFIKKLGFYVLFWFVIHYSSPTWLICYALMPYFCTLKMHKQTFLPSLLLIVSKLYCWISYKLNMWLWANHLISLGLSYFFNKVKRILLFLWSRIHFFKKIWHVTG